MTELLREQVYQQQVTNELEEEETAPSDTWWPGGSKDLPNSKKSASEVGSEHSFNNSLAEVGTCTTFVMVSMLTLSVVDHMLEPRSSQTKDSSCSIEEKEHRPVDLESG